MLKLEAAARTAKEAPRFVPITLPATKVSYGRGLMARNNGPLSQLIQTRGARHRRKRVRLSPAKRTFCEVVVAKELPLRAKLVPIGY
jgi:hypothetical protein